MIEKELKFVLNTEKALKFINKGLIHPKFEIEQHYLKKTGSRVRMIIGPQETSYYHTTKYLLPEIGLIEIEPEIDRETYWNLVQFHSEQSIRKTRYIIKKTKEHEYVMDFIMNGPDIHVTMLEVEFQNVKPVLSKELQNLVQKEIPFLSSEYTNKKIAKEIQLLRSSVE